MTFNNCIDLPLPKYDVRKGRIQCLYLYVLGKRIKQETSIQYVNEFKSYFLSAKLISKGFNAVNIINQFRWKSA